jgi:hypothetical protein
VDLWICGFPPSLLLAPSVAFDQNPQLWICGFVDLWVPFAFEGDPQIHISTLWKGTFWEKPKAATRESTNPHFHIVERHFLEKKSTAGAGGARQCSGWLFAWII